jgi:hypothetical protein
MAVFLKLASLGAVVCVGSLLTMWLLLGERTALAWLALAGTGVMAVGVIVLLTRETRLADRVQR